MEKEIIYCPHSTKFDYEKKFYSPMRRSKLNERFKLVFPHDKSNQLFNSKKLLQYGVHCVIAEITYPSDGRNIELGWADMLGVRIICVYKEGNTISPAYTAISKDFVEYKDEVEMISQLEKIIL